MLSLYDLSAYIGLLTIIYFCYQIYGFIHFSFHSSTLYRYVHNPNPDLKLDRQLSKPWAMVTGASDGIGKGLARELCRRGFHVVLHGRPGIKLQKVKTELETEFKSDVRTLALDASSIFNQADWEKKFEIAVRAAIEGVNLTVLINNLGGGGGIKNDFASIPERTFDEEEILLNINTRFMMHLTRIILPTLITNHPGLIVNLSSAVGSLPSPWFGVYAATKAFVQQYSSCLRLELKAEGKDVECVSMTVGKVLTTGAGRKAEEETRDAPSADKFANAVFDKIGYDSPAYAPYIWHRLQLGFLPILPRRMVENFMLDALDKESIQRIGKKKRV